ncbi:Lysosomal Pro-X carboxypeptidase, partial [Bienertia sinuspersici]
MAHHHVRSFLTIEQAFLKFNYSAQLSPVIVVGMGYGGAVWFRMKYPKIAVDALASSTPLYLYGNTTQHNGYCSIANQFFE